MQYLRNNGWSVSTKEYQLAPNNDCDGRCGRWLKSGKLNRGRETRKKVKKERDNTIASFYDHRCNHRILKCGASLFLFSAEYRRGLSFYSTRELFSSYSNFPSFELFLCSILKTFILG